MPDLPVTTRRRTQPVDLRASLMRDAGDMIGPETLADLLKVSKRTIYHWMSGERGVPDGVLAETRQLLIRRRQAIGELVKLFRAVEQGDAVDADAPVRDDAA